MPTPSPIIETSSGVIVLMSVKPATMKRSRNAVINATSASAIGNQSRDERAEDDQEHDQRRKQAKDLLDSLLDRRELGVAVELDGDAGRLDRLAHGLLHGLDLRAVLRVDDAVELGLRVRDPPVVGERVVVEGIADARDAGVAVRRRRRSARTRRSSARAIASSIAALRSGVSRRSPLGAPRRRGSGHRPAPRRTPPR